MMKTIKEINEKIKKGEAVIVRADEMPEIYEENPKRAAKEVDIVTTGTFGAMCSSGALLNFGHSDPPIKMQRIWLNNVEAYTGLAAVDAYLGATQLSEDRGFEYGGGHVIEDLVKGEEVNLRATAYRTDCYPRKEVETAITLNDMNQAWLLNPRNCYQKYNAAINSTNTLLQTYMGTLLPNLGNVNFSGTGEISPLNNDPNYETIGLGTRIFLCGAQGYVTSEGTQHSPKTQLGTLFVQGDLKEMSPEFIAGATIPNYGTSLFVGIGIPIPILNEDVAKSTAIRNKDLTVNLLDYGVPRRTRPVVREVNYEELFSGKVDINGKKVRTSSQSSMKVSHKIMETLGQWIEDKEFFLSKPIKNLPRDSEFKPMKVKEETKFVADIMIKKAVTARQKDSLKKVSELLIQNNIDQIPIVDSDDKLVGIVTTWDITKALAKGEKRISEIMTKRVITSRKDEPIDVVARKLDKNSIGSTPVVDEDNRVIGIITMADIIHRGVSK